MEFYILEIYMFYILEIDMFYRLLMINDKRNRKGNIIFLFYLIFGVFR